jgi:GNAT superfamily N-acetyltransferase
VSKSRILGGHVRGDQREAAIPIRAIRAGESDVCERILRALPEWFGIESALVQYVGDAQRLPTWVAELDGRPAGFITLRQHFSRAAEIHCMAVVPELHRRGIGRALVEYVVAECRKLNVAYLQVKTLGPARPHEPYARTRAFYEALGFLPLEEFPKLWPGNPALLLVRYVG